MYRPQKAFVLVVVMCLLMTMTLLSMASFEYSQLQLKMAQAYLQKNEIHSELLFQLKKIEKQLDDKQCLFDRAFATTYPTESIDWWREHGCMISAVPFRIYYVKEQLETDVCIRIYRLTLVAIANSGKFFLQTHEVSINQEIKECIYTVQSKHKGRQGIRWG